MKRVLCVLMLFVFTMAHAQEWDVTQIGDLHRWTFRMSQGGDSLGYSVFEIRKLAGQLLINEDSHVPSFREDIFCYVNPESLKPDSVLVTGRMSGFPIECKVKWQDGKAVGYANFPKHPSNPTKPIKVNMPEGTKVRLMSFVLSPFYKDLKVGDKFTYAQFSSTDGQIRQITASVTGTETMEVQGEKVEALKLELSGGVAEQNIYIDPVGKRIVRISFRNNNWIYELISS